MRPSLRLQDGTSIVVQAGFALRQTLSVTLWRQRRPAPNISGRCSVGLAGDAEGKKQYPCHAPHNDGRSWIESLPEERPTIHPSSMGGSQIHSDRRRHHTDPPEQFAKELRDLLQSWEDKGMAPIKELRSSRQVELDVGDPSQGPLDGSYLLQGAARPPE